MARLNHGGIADAIAFGRSSSERELMLYTAAALWTATALGMLFAGIAQPALSPGHVWTWRICFIGLAAVVVVSTVTWMRRLDDQRVYQAMFIICTASVLMNATMMIVNPLGIGAHFIALLAPAVFAAHFLQLRAAAAQIALITVCALVPALVYYNDSYSSHVLSRITAFLPILWAVAIAVYALHQNRVAAVARGEFAAHADSLTGVANLRAFEHHADEVLSERNARIAGSTALLLIDLDNFKLANTLHGHAGGDYLLRSVALGLERASSTSHMVARIGGDEFAVLIENVTPGDLPDLAIRYRNAVLSVSKRSEIEDVTIDASIGTAISNGDHATLADLMEAADGTMYKDKDRHTKYAEAHPRAMRRMHKPIDFRLPESADGPPDAEPLESDDDTPFSLRWSRRPAHARLLGLAWAGGATIGLVSLAVPDADRTHLAAAIAVLLSAYVVAAIAYVAAPAIGSWQHVAHDVFALATIAFLAYLTGGSDSPLWTLVFVFIIYEAWFLSATQIWMRLPGTLVVILVPLIYEQPSQISVATGATLYTAVLLATGLTIAMSYNQFLIDRTHRLTSYLSRVDSRTGLASRGEFERHAQETLDAFGDDRPDALTIVMIDLDNFKNVNTVHGHVEGDRLLKDIAAALASCARSTDCVARVGGDEFAVAMPQVSSDVARRLTLRFVDAVAACTARSELPACREVSASAGFALHGKHGLSLEELVSAADIALMAIKHPSEGVKQRVSGAAVMF